jgi:hypothetical protein
VEGRYGDEDWACGGLVDFPSLLLTTWMTFLLREGDRIAFFHTLHAYIPWVGCDNGLNDGDYIYGVFVYAVHLYIE